MNIAVLLNPSAGQDKGELQKLFASHGVKTKIMELDPATITEQAAKLAKSYDAVIAGGGDGTVSAVAAGLAGSATPLGVLPLGTLNHFAKDLNISIDLEAAVKTIAKGQPKPVDVAEVNGRIFINNSSVGLYPKIVRLREERENRLGKWPALLVSLWRSLINYRAIKLRYVIDGRDVTARVSMAFVGNNDYGVEDPGASNRVRLDQGVLSLYIVPARGRLSLTWAALVSLWRPGPQHLERYYPTEVTIDLPGAETDLALDGELVKMQTPLVYQSRPKALHVLV